MPNYFTYAGFKLYFWSNESEEPIHVHVSKGRPSSASTKFWLLSNGEPLLANNKAELSQKEIKLISRFISANCQEIDQAWKNFFRLDKVKYIK